MAVWPYGRTAARPHGRSRAVAGFVRAGIEVAASHTEEPAALA